MANTALNHKADVNVDVELSKLDNRKIFIGQYRVLWIKIWVVCYFFWSSPFSACA